MTSGLREQNPNFTWLSGGPGREGPSPLTHTCMHTTSVPHAFRHSLTHVFLCTRSCVETTLTYTRSHTHSSHTLIHTHAVHTRSYLVTPHTPTRLLTPIVIHLCSHLTHTPTRTHITRSTKQGAWHRGVTSDPSHPAPSPILSQQAAQATAAPPKHVPQGTLVKASFWDHLGPQSPAHPEHAVDVPREGQREGLA